MAFCNAAGIPHSAFLNWDPEDRAKALAQKLEESLACPMCGTADWEWDPKQGGSRFAYEAVPHFCPGCYAKEHMSRDLNDAPGTTIQLAPGNDESARERRRIARELEARGD